MRILIVSNFYPPHAIGGMEYRCHETANLLQKRGHDVLVLTSTYGICPKGIVDGNVYRLLVLESDLMHYKPLHFFLKSWQEEKQNLDNFKNVLYKFMPDVIFIWGMWNLTRQLPFYAEQFWERPVIYSLASDWPAQPNIHELYWRLPAQRRLLKPIKKVLSKIALVFLKYMHGQIDLQFNYVICASQTLCQNLRQAGVPLKRSHVIYPGIDLEQFSTNSRSKEMLSSSRTLSLLYAGSLVAHKGVHTAVEAIGYLLKQEPNLNLKLTVVGSGHKLYEAYLHNLVINNSLQSQVCFIEQIPREEMPALMQSFDILLFPSIWEEPFSRVILEAMASGLVVIGTNTGGTKEILKDGDTGMIFPPEDSTRLAESIRQLINNPDLMSKLAKNGRAVVEQQFDIRQMVNEIETYLDQIAKSFVQSET
jgi:glycogen synthase